MNQTRKYIVIALVVKALMLALWVGSHQHKNPDSFLYGWIFEHNDYHYFLTPVDNYFETGKYEYLPGQTYSGRLPGYWFPYMALRFVFSKAIALNLLVFFQYLLSAISVVFLARTAELITRSTRAFRVVFYLFLLSSFTSVFDYQTITESFSVSSMIFFFYFLVRYIQENQARWIFWAGVFLTWAIFLRPFLGLGLFIVPFILLVHQRKKFAKTILHLILFGSSFVVVESAWIVRNYMVTNQFMLLTSGASDYGRSYSAGWLDLRRTMYHWGGQSVYFEPGMAQWFRQSPMDEDFPFPDYVFEGVSYTYEDLLEIKRLYQQNLHEESEETFLANDSLIRETALQWRAEFKEAHYFRHSVLSGVLGMKRMLLSSGSTFLPFPPFAQMAIWQKGIKLSYVLLYYFVFLGSFLGLIFLTRQSNTRIYAWIIGLLSLQLVLVLAYYSPYQGPRYTITLYPWYVLLTGILLAQFGRFKQPS